MPPGRDCNQCPGNLDLLTPASRVAQKAGLVLAGCFPLVQIKCNSFTGLEFGKVIQTLIDPKKEGLVDTFLLCIGRQGEGLVSPYPEWGILGKTIRNCHVNS